MTSEIDLCNRSLSLIGTRSTISSFTEGSAESVQCAIHYANVRDSLLRVHHWNFARKQMVLALLGAAAGTTENPNGTGTLPPTPWQYMYAYPQDTAKARFIVPQYANTAIAWVPFSGTPVRYVVAASNDSSGNEIVVILTDQSQASLVYTALIKTPDIFDQNFTDALVYGLAGNLAIALAGDQPLSNIMRSESNKNLKLAQAINGNEGITVQNTMPDWINVRGTLADPYGDGGSLPYRAF